MKAQRPYPQITITPKGEAALVGGHPWVYEGEVTGLSGPVSDGQLVDVISRRGSWLGCGFFNSRSRIRVRVLSRNPNDRFDRAFWRRRIQYAWDYRKTVMGPEDSRCCRMIFGEADGFPGLTVDRFESVLVAQVLCLGMELIKEELFSLLLEVLRSDGQDVVGVYERNDVAIRDLEGMEQGKGWHPVDGEKAPGFTAVDIEENGIRYTVDFENGQKTGFFLDPPAFTKSRKTTQRAMTGYKEINYRAMRLLPRGGYLATCSCSHFATEELFLKMLRSAAKDAGVQLRQIEARQQCCDHPILWGVEETNYLKFYLFQVV